MNIPGIEILNKTEIIENSLNNGLVATTITLILFGIVFLVITSATSEDSFGFAGLIVLALALLTLIFSCVFPDKNPTGRYEYELFVSDEADVRQLCEEYEIVEVRGKIYIVRDLELETSTDSCCDCDKHFHKNKCVHHDRVSPENTKNHNHTHKQKHGCIEENVESKNPKAEVPNEPETSAEDIDNVCDNCKSILEENDKFCFQCGHKRKDE